MRFQVPQFIDHEAKVIGPLTFRQFIYVGIPGAIAFFLYFLAPFFVFIIASVILGTFGFMFAFIKIGGRSLPNILVNFSSFTLSPKRYIWRKGKTPIQTPQAQYQKPAEQSTTKEIKLVQKSRIKDLSTRVETNR
jgi:hypothetical protein